MQIKKITAFMLLALTPCFASAAVYKWVDANGNVQYSSEKPMDAEAEKIKLSSQPQLDSGYSKPSSEKTPAASSASKSNAGDDKPKNAAEKRAEAIKKSDSEKIKKEMCEEAKKTLADISNSDKVRAEDANGQVRYMSKDEITKRKAIEQESVKKYCK